MDKKATLVIMAAGMGSRFGGLKQIEPVGPSDEIILDYSIYDAVKAGFSKVIFVIKHEIEDAFKEIIGTKYDGKIQIEYAYQCIDSLPEGYSVPEGRTKPWGTGHAILSCKELVDGPFAVINADDYYGSETFKVMYDELVKEKPESDVYDFSMVAFKIENTITENGSVARGVCREENGYLAQINERTKIMEHDGKIAYTEDDESWTEIPQGTPVSMNLWGFTEELMPELEKKFAEFLESNKDNLLKGEFFIPFVVDDLIKEGKARVRVLETPEKWYGVTYKEDKFTVMKALEEKTKEGVYPSPLW